MTTLRQFTTYSQPGKRQRVWVKNGEEVKAYILVVLLLLQSKISAGFFTTNSTILENAVSVGAVCLDGSPPAYLFGEGFGEGKQRWIVYLMGGEWCSNIFECKNRKTSHLGSSLPKYWNDSKFNFQGILDFDQTQNPDFYSWNKVAVRYCDGSSFTGDIESVDPTTGLHFRGRRIFDAVVEDLLVNRGMKDATHAFLTGGSAGGLSVMIHCDRFSTRFPNTATTVKCLSDAGFFLHSKHPAQARDLESKFRGIVDLHNSTGVLSETCKSRMKDLPYLCFFPQFFAKDIHTPLFIMITTYDSYQMNHTLSTDFYYAVKFNHISATQYTTLKEFRLQMLDELRETDTPSRGLFVSNCFTHTRLTHYWNQRHGFDVNNRTDVEAVGAWFFDRTCRVQEVDQNTLVKDCINNTYIKEGGA
nr:pectin acetylesterase 8-like [Ipomoea batatas]